jgi:hypothetical protein
MRFLQTSVRFLLPQSTSTSLLHDSQECHYHTAEFKAFWIDNLRWLGEDRALHLQGYHTLHTPHCVFKVRRAE